MFFFLSNKKLNTQTTIRKSKIASFSTIAKPRSQQDQKNQWQQESKTNNKKEENKLPKSLTALKYGCLVKNIMKSRSCDFDDDDDDDAFFVLIFFIIFIYFFFLLFNLKNRLLQSQEQQSQH